MTIRFRAQIYTGDIPEAYRAAVFIGAQNDVAEFFLGGKAAGRGNRGSKPLTRHRRFRTDLTGRHLYVLATNCLLYL